MRWRDWRQCHVKMGGCWSKYEDSGGVPWRRKFVHESQSFNVLKAVARLHTYPFLIFPSITKALLVRGAFSRFGTRCNTDKGYQTACNKKVSSHFLRRTEVL